MNIVEKMMAFRDSQDIAQLGVDKCVDLENLNVIVIEILSWLKLQYKRELWIAQGRKTKLKPMDLNYEFPWCNELESYINDNNTFGEHFIIIGKTMEFKDEIPLDYILTARKLAFELYNPEKIV